MQASRPRALITPLQLGLEVQVHHNFASRFLVSTLNSLGFCSSYYEVQKFESSAAAVQGVDLPGDISNSFVQFVADNVDHNTRTIDGLNTFHGMGIIAGITPVTKRTQPIPRIAFSTDKIKIWDITETRRKIDPLVCNILPFIHAFSGCDTTSRIFGQGKGTVFKKISTNIKLQDHAAVFCQESNVESMHKAGEQIFVALYGGLQDVETLDMLRYRIFASKVCVGNIYVQVHTLPPTSDAAKLHCMRVYHQTQVWIGKGDK
ncbi:uncharacterized protein LOC134684250 [Mytilus trossulus]|uniref:uncharacterized protein LOC134684250 n=1 Tax=Mytilus trossulus TaxID=6551 RepID=UPI003003B245